MSKRLIAVIAAVIAGLLVTGVIAWRTFGGGSDSVDVLNATYRKVGAGVAVTKDAPQNIKASKAKPAPAFAGGIVPLAPSVEATPSGAQPGPITLRFELDAKKKVASKADVLIATSKSGKPGTWRLLAATEVSRDGRYAYITTDHLSFWQPLLRRASDLIAAFKDEIKKGINDLTSNVAAEATKPSCPGESEVRAMGYSVTSKGDSLYWCLGLEKGRPTLHVVNKRRYPLIVIHGSLKPAYMHHIDFGANLLAAKLAGKGRTTVFPFDEVVFSVSLDDGKRITLDAEYDGVAQALYQLEFGVTTALNILDRFGAGGGVIRNGAITKSQFDRVADVMGKLLSAKSCLNEVFKGGDVSFGSVMSNCMSADQIMTAFGWKGVLIAPAIIAGQLVEFFRSEFNALGDMLRNRTNYTITIRYNKPDPLVSYVGKWSVHGVGPFRINADGSGKMMWNAGPCIEDIYVYSPMCSGHATLKFVGKPDGSLVGTYVRVWFTTWAGGKPPAGSTPEASREIRRGMTFTVRHNDAHTLITSGQAPPGNPYLCDAYAYAHNGSTYRLCGA